MTSIENLKRPGNVILILSGIYMGALLIIFPILEPSILSFRECPPEVQLTFSLYFALGPIIGIIGLVVDLVTINKKEGGNIKTLFKFSSEKERENTRFFFFITGIAMTIAFLLYFISGLLDLNSSNITTLCIDSLGFSFFVGMIVGVAAAVVSYDNINSGSKSELNSEGSK